MKYKAKSFGLKFFKHKNLKRNFTKSRVVELHIAGVNENKKKLLQKNCMQQKKIKDKATKPTIHKQTIFLKRIFPFRKTGPGQIRTQDLCGPRRFRYLLNKCAGTLKN